MNVRQLILALAEMPTEMEVYAWNDSAPRIAIDEVWIANGIVLLIDRLEPYKEFKQLKGNASMAIIQTLDAYANAHSVVKRGAGVWFPKKLPEQMPEQEALVFAAYIVRALDESGERFAHILRQVRGKSSTL